MGKLKILILEDNEFDAKLIKEELIAHKVNFISKLVDTKKDFIKAIKDFKPDIILSDYNLPQLTGIDALEIAQKIIPNIPFIIVTGVLSEEIAADTIKRGVWDYVIKDNLLRLSPAIENALKLKEEKDKNIQVEKELLKLSAAVRQSANTIMITDPNGNIEYTNPKFTELTGYTFKEVLGKNPRILNSGFQSKDFYVKMWNTIIAGKVWRGEFKNKSKSGKFFWEQATLTPIKDNEGKIVNYLAVKEDITERKKAEKALLESEVRYSNIVRSLLVGVVIHIYNKIVFVNDAIINLLGFSSEKELLGRNILEFVHPEDQKKTKKDYITSASKIKNSKGNKNVPIIIEVRFIKADGSEIIAEATAILINYYGKKALMVMVNNITKRKEAENNLQIAYEEVNHLKRQLEIENVSLKEEISLSFNYEDMVYSSQEISDVLTQVEQVSSTNATVLILGETGTGKELIAKAIHNTSDRKDKQLIRVNCAAIPAELLESELFGHKKGSFTGAIKDRIGKFQLANEGTLFLDEIGEMPLSLQPKLLRAIQEGEIEPIGSSKFIKLDIRIIAATNRELEKEVEKKRFRQDLFFRLNVFPIFVPPLRERIEDIPVLLDHFLKKYCLKYRKNLKLISNETLQQLKLYPWPGNVRELENLVERATITSNKDTIVFQEFDNSSKSNKVKSTNNSLDEIQSNHIIKTLNLTQWKISGKEGAAELLDIKPSTLRDRMKKFGIKRPQ